MTRHGMYSLGPMDTDDLTTTTSIWRGLRIGGGTLDGAYCGAFLSIPYEPSCFPVLLWVFVCGSLAHKEESMGLLLQYG
jgi:hypothetical protein